MIRHVHFCVLTFCSHQKFRQPAAADDFRNGNEIRKSRSNLLFGDSQWRAPLSHCDGRFEKSERLARTTRQAELCESCRVCRPASASACVAGCSKEVWVTYSFGCPSPLPRSGELRLVSRQIPRLECLERRLPRRLGSAGTKEYRHERSRFAVPVRVQARRRRQFQQLARLTC